MIRGYSVVGALRRVSRTKSVVNGWLTYSCATLARLTVWNCMIIILIHLAGTNLPLLEIRVTQILARCTYLLDERTWHLVNLQFTFQEYLRNCNNSTRFYKNEFTLCSRLQREKAPKIDPTKDQTSKNGSNLSTSKTPKVGTRLNQPYLLSLSRI